MKAHAEHILAKNNRKALFVLNTVLKVLTAACNKIYITPI